MTALLPVQNFVPNDPMESSHDQYFDVMDLFSMAQSFPEKRITVWNVLERRKISGNAAPMGKNLIHYLSRHPECEIFVDQDKFSAPTRVVEGVLGEPFSFNGFPDACHFVPRGTAFPDAPSDELPGEKRVTIWHRTERRKISGNAAPMERNLVTYLSTHPECEVFVNQDKDTQIEEVASAPIAISCDMSEPAIPNIFPPLSPLPQFDAAVDVAPLNLQVVGSTYAPMSPCESLGSAFGAVDWWTAQLCDRPSTVTSGGSTEKFDDSDGMLMDDDDSPPDHFQDECMFVLEGV